MFDLTGKRALVTGATGGLGGAIAQALIAQGAQLAVSGTRAEKLDTLVTALGGAPVALACDLSDAAAVDALVPRTVEALGGIDILVSNAGITKDGLLLRMKDEDWSRVLTVNLEAHFRLCRAALKPMMKQRFGRIIGITSVVGVTGNPGQTNYAASKAGMIGFTKALAQEAASRGVTANCVAPGFIASPMTDALNADQKEAILANVPAGRLGEGADVAGAVVYLASAAGGYVTGQTLHVNGGMAMI
ncbi:MAG: 3-oxoacyl-[acyl-carrier-protein] reductase [Maricaulaceae bacterium]